MYGGENNTGLNSQNEDEVILYFVKLIRIFYYPCNNMNYHQLDPMEQYIRFNLDLYRRYSNQSSNYKCMSNSKK